MKTFLKEVLLPLLIALCLAAFFKPVYKADGVCDYFLMWLCVGFPFGIRRMCLWLVPFGYGISGTVGIFALNIICLLYTSIRPIIHVSAVNDELLSAVGKLTAEYGRIGGNLNQIARYLNEYGAPYNALSGEVRAAIALSLIHISPESPKGVRP